MTKINKKEKSDRFDSWDISKHSIKKLNDWILWARNEITEYEMFIKLIKKEIKIRK